MITAAIVTTLAASFCYALCAAVQQRQAAASHTDGVVRPGLLLELLRRPMWLAGMAVGALGEALHLAALAWAPLALVQPLGVATVIFALVLGAALAKRRPRMSELAPAAITVAGLVALLAGLHITDAPPSITGAGLIALTCLTAVALVGTIIAARRAGGAARTMLLACGAGVAFGVTAALASLLAHDIASHGVVALVSWATPIVVAAAVTGVLLEQAAYKSGHLAVAVAGMAVTDPLVAVLAGAALLHQPAGVAHPLLALVEAAVVAVGVVQLARITAAPQPSLGTSQQIAYHVDAAPELVGTR